MAALFQRIVLGHGFVVRRKGSPSELALQPALAFHFPLVITRECVAVLGIVGAMIRIPAVALARGLVADVAIAAGAARLIGHGGGWSAMVSAAHGSVHGFRIARVAANLRERVVGAPVPQVARAGRGGAGGPG